MLRIVLGIPLLIALSTNTAEAEGNDSKQIELTTNSGAAPDLTDLFKVNFTRYIQRAKELSVKIMSTEEVDELTNKAWSIIEDIRSNHKEKLKTQKFELKYLNGKPFPDQSEHQGNNESDQKVVKFTIACYMLDKLITKDIVRKVVEKSPLEMVSIVKEILIFYQFISADPADFGHGTFLERQNESTVTIFATNDAILRIMGVLIYKNLIDLSSCYKVSRVGSSLTQRTEIPDEAALTEVISSLKRSPADDSRVALNFPNELPNVDETSDKTNSFKRASVGFLSAIYLSRQFPDKQLEYLDKAEGLAKNLLGIIPGVNVTPSKKVLEFCKTIDKQRSELEKVAESSEGKKALKAKRDASNYIQATKFLKSMLYFVEALYTNQQILQILLTKLSEFVPILGKEVTEFWKAVGLMNGEVDSIDKIINSLKEFAKSSDDGCYLLSPITSIAMNTDDKPDFEKILQDPDLQIPDYRKYLKIR